MEDKRRLSIIAFAVSLVGIAFGGFLASSLLPSLAAERQHDEKSIVSKTVRAVVTGDEKAITTKTVETVVHLHDGFPLHKHVTTVVVKEGETTPHETFHDFVAAQPEVAVVTPAVISPGQNAAPNQEENQILVLSMEFMPADLTVAVGASVKWVSKDSLTHTVTSDSGIFGGAVIANGSFTFTFSEPGTYNYHCEYRPEMVGVITVR